MDPQHAEPLVERLGRDIEVLAKRLLTAACERHLRLATAESCTGGLLASILTDVEGRSHAFDRAFVVYTDAAKTDLLGVPAELLEAEGAVSDAVARAMALGALARSQAHLAASLTGFAGPGGPGETPGLVFVAVARGDTCRCRRLDLGDIGREPVRLEAIEVALQMMLALAETQLEEIAPSCDLSR